jgi:HK97 family phage major capsid protein
MEAEVRAEATEQFAKAEGAAFLSGSGVGRPFGFLNNASIATVNSGAAAALTADGLLSVYYGIKTDYARAAVWMLNRSTIGQIRRLKDGDGEYLWAASPTRSTARPTSRPPTCRMSARRPSPSRSATSAVAM